jgi:hypothetical protein
MDEKPYRIGDESTPDVEYLAQAWKKTLDDLAEFVDQCNDNYKVRYAVWAGQHDSGKKMSADAFPWKGASDLRVYEVDKMIQSHKALLLTSHRRSNLVAVPVEGNDISRARVVGNFMRWLVMTQIPHIEREVALCADYMLEKGISATGQFWEKCQSKVVEEMTLEQIAQVAPQLAQDVIGGTMDDVLVGLLQQAYPGMTVRKAKRALKSLRETGRAEMVVPGRVYNRPVVRAFTLDEDLFIPINVTDIEHAPYIFRKHYYTPEQMREKVAVGEWDGDWVEQTILTQKGKDMDLIQNSTQESIRRNFYDEARDVDGLVLVVYAYQKLTDEDGVSGIYETIFNPHTEGYAKHGLLSYRHGQYPFVIFRREYLSRRLHDSRGIPEVGEPYQVQIKVQRDSRIDNTSLATLPPFYYPIGRPPTNFGPGAKIGVRRPQEYGYIDRPPFPQASIEVEQTLLKSFGQYFGMPTDELDVVESRLKQQDMVERWLSSWSQVYQQVWSLFQQFGDDQVYFRVIGSVKGKPEQFEKGSPDEKYDFYISYDVLMTDDEKKTDKIKQLIELAQTIDRNGQIDYSELLQAAVEAIDPILGERVIQPKEAASVKEVNEEMSDMAQMFAGIDKNIPLGAANELRLQVIQQIVGSSPEWQARLQNKEDPLSKRLEKRVQQYQHQLQQQQNAIIGRYGA